MTDNTARVDDPVTSTDTTNGRGPTDPPVDTDGRGPTGEPTGTGG